MLKATYIGIEKIVTIKLETLRIKRIFKFLNFLDGENR